MKRHYHLFVVLLFIVTACDTNVTATIPPPTAQPTAVVTQAPTLIPTITPQNTPAPLSTATSVPPTNTPAPTAKPPAPSPTTKPQGFNMRAVDWFKVVTTDPNLNYDPTISPPPGLGKAPWVKVKANDSAAGHALIMPEQIVYLDISGDGQEEAVLSLFSGGTAGNLGLLVYTVANPALSGVEGNAPILVDSLAGYKIGGVADGKLLKVIEPIYQGWEPNCCPSGFFETRYRLQANKLAQVSRDEKPSPEARKLTVDKFYELLAAKNYADAWNNFLGSDYKTGRSYDAWVAGYANTISFTATTSDLPDGRVKVDITSTDKTPTGNVTKKFTGTWTLVWRSTARFKQWALDKAQFTAVK